MKSKIQRLGRIKKEFPPRGNLQLYQARIPHHVFLYVRKVEATSTKVALLQNDELLSNGVSTALLARHQST
jgi:hypothetical protein